MSATGRGAKRADSDFYPTPAGATLAILRALNLPGGRWLEPAAGEGAIIRAVNSTRADIDWTAVELREACRPHLVAADPRAEVIAPCDFLAMEAPRSFSVAILNPPFVLALPFVDRCLGMADWVVALERTNWIASGTRNRWFRAHMPDVYVLSNRPSFTGNGSTDMAEYAWFVWPPGEHHRAIGRAEVLESNPGQGSLLDGLELATAEAR